MTRRLCRSNTNLINTQLLQRGSQMVPNSIEVLHTKALLIVEPSVTDGGVLPDVIISSAKNVREELHLRHCREYAIREGLQGLIDWCMFA